MNRRKRERYSKSLEGLFLFTYFDSQAQWSLPLSSHGLAYPYFQISLCIKETASTTWLNLEFNQKNVAGERNMGIIVLRTKLRTDGRNARKEKKKKSKRENERKSLRIVVNNIPIGIVPKSIQYIYSPNNQFPREYSQLIQHWSQLKIIRETFFYTTLIKRTKATRYIYIYFQWIAHTFTTLKVIEVESR